MTPLAHSHQDAMGSFLPDSGSYELLAVIGKFLLELLGASTRGHQTPEEPPGTDPPHLPPPGRGLDDLMTVNLACYRPSGEHVAIRRIDLESCTNDMVACLQVAHLRLHFHLHLTRLWGDG